MVLISVVAPIYNEEKVLKEFSKQVIEYLKMISDDYTLILVDDGSLDNSWNYIKEICESNKKVKGLRLSKNFGHHYAITAGIHKADSEWVIVMDSDLQDRPQVILDLFKKASEGFDIVFVSRANRPESNFYLYAQKLFYLFLNFFSGQKFDSSQANYSIINKKVVDAYKLFPEQARFYPSTIKWLGFKKTSITATHGKRFSGKPSYTFKSRLRLALDIILSFSDKPLWFSVYIGTILSIISLLTILIIILNFIVKSLVFPYWIIILLSIFFIGGVQISMIGIISIYISKIFNEVKSRPLFLIQEEIN